MSTLIPEAETAAAPPGEAQVPASNVRTRFAFLAETSRCLANSLDFETTLATGAGLALPYFGTWCMIDIVEADGTIRRVAVIHPDPGKQRQARKFYDAHPPAPGDPLGAARVIRTLESQFVLAYDDDVLQGIAEEEHRLLLQDLGAASFLMVPMMARGRTLGAITFVSDHRRDYDDADLLLAEDLGRRCGQPQPHAHSPHKRCHVRRARRPTPGPRQALRSGATGRCRRPWPCRACRRPCRPPAGQRSSPAHRP